MNVDDKIVLLGDILDPGLDPAEGTSREILFRAVGRTFELLAEVGEDPEDDKWLADRDLFVRVAKPLIVASWREVVGGASTTWPWGDDALRRAWLEWRVPHAWPGDTAVAPRGCSWQAVRGEPLEIGLSWRRQDGAYLGRRDGKGTVHPQGGVHERVAYYFIQPGQPAAGIGLCGSDGAYLGRRHDRPGPERYLCPN